MACVFDITLTPNKGDDDFAAAVHSLFLAGDASIPQLQDGHGYYVINDNGNALFQLSADRGQPDRRSQTAAAAGTCCGGRDST